MDDAHDGAPLEEPAASQPMLPLDEPVPYALTARARLRVADAALPSLRVVVGGGARHVDLDAADDANRARARALHRAGVPTAQVAAELDVDPLHVAAWVADLPPAGGGLRVVAAAPEGTDAARDPAARAAAVAARVEARRAAVDEGAREAGRRLEADPTLRTGLGLLGGVLQPDDHALLLDAADAALVAATWSWVRATLEVPVAGTRVLVRHAPTDAGDRAAHRVAVLLDVPLDVVATSRDPSVGHGAPAVTVRHADAALAARAAGWRQHLLAELAGRPSSSATW